MIGSSQRLLHKQSTKQEKNICTPTSIQTCEPSNHETSHLRFRPHGHWHQPVTLLLHTNKHKIAYLTKQQQKHPDLLNKPTVVKLFIFISNDSDSLLLLTAVCSSQQKLCVCVCVIFHKFLIC